MIFDTLLEYTVLRQVLSWYFIHITQRGGQLRVVLKRLPGWLIDEVQDLREKNGDLRLDECICPFWLLDSSWFRIYLLLVLSGILHPRGLIRTRRDFAQLALSFSISSEFHRIKVFLNTSAIPQALLRL